MIFITFPEQITIPENVADLSCFSSFTNIIEQTTCTYDPEYPEERTVKIKMLYADGVNQISDLDRFSVTLNNIKNPPTTQITDSIKVVITILGTEQSVN